MENIMENVCKILLDNVGLIEKKRVKLVPYCGSEVSTYNSSNGFLVIEIPEVSFKETVLYILGEFHCGVIYPKDFSYFVITCGQGDGEAVFVRHSNHDVNWNPLLKSVLTKWNKYYENG